jgi:AcrR family transcriptional regulator
MMYIELRMSSDVSPRPYKSPRRETAATRTREGIVKTAVGMLGTADGIGGFSLDAVARKAGVTRLTVYNHFGSRRALLEAVFDERAARGGLHRIADAMSGPDPKASLRKIVVIFCDFWSFDPGTMGYLYAAAASDPEFDESVRERNERRRQVLSVLVRRVVEGRTLKPKARDELVDVLFALTSFPFFLQLMTRGRTAAAVCGLIEELAMAAVKRIAAG